MNIPLTVSCFVHGVHRYRHTYTAIDAKLVIKVEPFVQM